MLAIVLLTDNSEVPIVDQAMTVGLMLAVLAFAWGAMPLAGPIIRLIGVAGTEIVSRVMGMILASVAAYAVLEALLEILATGRL
jgi:multiple antibiotic resistance protein